MNRINPKYVAANSLIARRPQSCHAFSGGSIALTHPLGMSALSTTSRRVQVIDGITAGVRQAVTGLEELRRRNEDLLCTSMCIGSGMGAAGIFVNERRS
jgi:acetyl-CoA acyltransferase 1